MFRCCGWRRLCFASTSTNVWVSSFQGHGLASPTAAMCLHSRRKPRYVKHTCHRGSSPGFNPRQATLDRSRGESMLTLCILWQCPWVSMQAEAFCDGVSSQIMQFLNNSLVRGCPPKQATTSRRTEAQRGGTAHMDVHRHTDVQTHRHTHTLSLSLTLPCALLRARRVFPSRSFCFSCWYWAVMAYPRYSSDGVLVCLLLADIRVSFRIWHGGITPNRLCKQPSIIEQPR